MIVRFSPLAWTIRRSVDITLNLKCAAMTPHGNYIISNRQLKLAGVPDVEPFPPVCVKGKRWKNHTAIRSQFIEVQNGQVQTTDGDCHRTEGEA